MAKFMDMDRSRFRNPDMPAGYVKGKPELMYKDGVEIDGEHYIVAAYIWNTHMYEREDYATLSDFILSDEESMVEDTAIDEHIEESSAVSSNSVPKKRVESIIIKKEPEDKESVIPEKAGASEKHKVSKHGKKRNDSSDSSTLDAFLSQIDIDPEKHKKKKAKKEKKEYKSDYPDDSSASTSSSSHKRTLVRYSPSPSPERYLDVKIKDEPLDQPQHLFGSYICDVCNITMNSLLTYKTHINGKKHRKNMKAKNVSEVVAQSIPQTVVSEDQSKYPIPRPGIVRKKVREPAKIQHIVENEIKTPCPGLNFVIEIQGIEAVQYYCSMCDSLCSSNSIIPHLMGFKHQLKSVKQFKPGAYDRMCDEPKYRIEKELLSILRAVQKKEGMGRMAVEIEEFVSDPKDMTLSGNYPSKDCRSQPSTSWEPSKKQPGMSFPETYNYSTVPNKTASDFYCEICDSHMNAIQMWEAHIRGKRHLTNLKKMPGDRPSKIKTIPLPNERAAIIDQLEVECPGEPIVGLKEIRETQIPETRSCSYQCFLCGSCHTTMDIVEHLISLKHRIKYLDHVNFPGRDVITGMSELNSLSLVRDMCAEVEAMEGCGKPSVHMSKTAMYR